MTDIEARILGDLQVLKTQMEQLMGNGQPGRLHDLEHRVVTTETSMQRMRGVVAAFGVVLTMLDLAITYLGNHH